MYSTEELLRPQFELTGMNKVSDERTAIMVWPEGLDDSVDEDGSYSRRRDCHLAAPPSPSLTPAEGRGVCGRRVTVSPTARLLLLECDGLDNLAGQAARADLPVGDRPGDRPG